jgi:hypothetical protein
VPYSLLGYAASFGSSLGRPRGGSRATSSASLNGTMTFLRRSMVAVAASKALVASGGEGPRTHSAPAQRRI